MRSSNIGADSVRRITGRGRAALSAVDVHVRIYIHMYISIFRDSYVVTRQGRNIEPGVAFTHEQRVNASPTLRYRCPAADRRVSLARTRVADEASLSLFLEASNCTHTRKTEHRPYVRAAPARTCVTWLASNPDALRTIKTRG